MREPILEITPGAAVLFPLWYYLDREGWFATVLPAVFFHELGHLAALRWFHRRVHRLRIGLTGLCLETAPLPDTAAELLCLAAGPGLGFLWALLATGLPGTWGEKCAVSALWLNALNLTPALPLDGGRMLLSVSGSPRLTRLISAGSALALAGIGAWLRLWGLLLMAGVLLRYILTPE